MHPAPAAPAAPSCRACGAPLHHVMVDLGMSPLANSYRAPEQTTMEPFYPLRVYVCHECLLAQIEPVARPEEIFSDYAYFSSYSDTWLAHARAYAELAIRRFGLGPRSRVVEIASNDGYLLQYFAARGIPVLGIEPARNVAAAAAQKGIPTLTEFFGAATARRLKADGHSADLLVGNNVLAHVPELNDFVEGLRTLLLPGGVITMEFPHLLRLMAENQFDTIYHEHVFYYSLTAAERVFRAHGLTLFDVEELPTHGGSLRIYACRAGARQEGARVAALRAREEAAGLTRMATYGAFGARVRETKRQLLEFLIAAKRQGKAVVGYGAAAKGNTLLNYCGIRTDFLDYTVDRSPHKQGRLLPGTQIPIHAPDRVRETRPDYLLILPWNLREEIMRQMAYIREWGGQFLVPIPGVQVYP
ncbi:MAG: methyltransferase domain-containing protein [Candidatus Methylomirabilales bacterium]